MTLAVVVTTMKLEWNENKRLINLQRHQIDSADVKQVFDNKRRTIVDDRFDYGEIRFFTPGLLNNRVVAVSHTETDDLIRIISARKADKNDIENVLKQNEKITKLKFVREVDLYPANTKNINPNDFYVDFSLKQQICDSEYPEFHFSIQPEKKITTIKFLFANFKCKEKSLKPYTNNTLEQYEQEFAAIFEREVIEKLRQNDSR